MSEKNECCPKFDPKLWEGKEITWREKLFIKDTVPQLFHIPLPCMFAKTVAKMWTKIETADAKPADKDFLMLAHDPSPWKSELFINTTKEVPNAENIKLSGTYLTRVFDGPFSAIYKWIKEMNEYVKQKGYRMDITKLYVYYTTCPKCAKKYGHNYVVMFAQIR